MDLEHEEELMKPTRQLVYAYLRQWWEREGYPEQEYVLNRLFFALIPKNDCVEKIAIKITALNNFYGTSVMRPDQLAREMMKIPDLDAKIRGETEDYITVVDEIAQALKRCKSKQKKEAQAQQTTRDEQSDNLSSGFAVLKKFNDELGYLKLKSTERLHPAWAKKDDEREYFSFATKFCSHHDPSGKLFPIYDQFVADLLCSYSKANIPGVEDRQFYDYSRIKDDLEITFKGRHVLTKNKLRHAKVFKDVVEQFQRKYDLEDFSFKQIDRFLWQYGKEYYFDMKKRKKSGKK